MTKLSSSQHTFQREKLALENMPSHEGRAACAGNQDFDVLVDGNRVAQNVRNALAKVCASCPLVDCGWRQTRKLPSGYVKMPLDQDA